MNNVDQCAIGEQIERLCAFKIGQVVRFRTDPKCEAVVLTRSFVQGLSSGVALRYFVANAVQKEFREVYEQEIEAVPAAPHPQ